MVTVQDIRNNPIVAVIRKASVDNIVPIVQALREGGIKSVEITAETPGITKIIEKVKAENFDDVLLGAGTVLDAETARAAIMAGAEYIVSPTLNVETIKMANRYGVLAISGAFTPTEILTAYENGSAMVKVFPANALGPSYIKNVHGPLPQIPIMVTGGITLENMNDYFSEGSDAVGIGSNLVNIKELADPNGYNKLTNKAREFVEKYKEIQ